MWMCGEGKLVVKVVCHVGGSTGVLIKFVELIRCGDGCVIMKWGLFGGVGGWMSGVWTRDVFYMLKRTRSMGMVRLI